MSHGRIERRRFHEQTQPITWHLPLGLYQFLLNRANSFVPPKAVPELLNERLLTPGLANCADDVKRIVRKIAEREGVQPDVLIADWVRERAEYEAEMAGMQA